MSMCTAIVVTEANVSLRDLRRLVDHRTVTLFENLTCSFIVRIWIEEPDPLQRQHKWRGTITHVPSQRQRHFEEGQIIWEFIAPYLQQMGAELRE